MILMANPIRIVSFVSAARCGSLFSCFSLVNRIQLFVYPSALCIQHNENGFKFSPFLCIDIVISSILAFDQGNLKFDFNLRWCKSAISDPTDCSNDIVLSLYLVQLQNWRKKSAKIHTYCQQQLRMAYQLWTALLCQLERKIVWPIEFPNDLNHKSNGVYDTIIKLDFVLARYGHNQCIRWHLFV